MSAEIKSKTPLFAQKEKRRGWWAGWMTHLCGLISKSLYLPEKPLNWARQWKNKSGELTHRNLASFISLLGAEYGVHIEVPVTFEREGQGFDGTFL